MSDTTIAALATPAGRGGVAIVRLSGPAAVAIASQLVKPLPAPRQAAYRHFLDADGGIIDDGICLFFPAPASFTGEDVVELQGHGGPIIIEALLARLFALGARQAHPGEFSQRAFLNGRIDLVQAEAIADLIDSSSREASRAARRSLQGEFSQRINRLVDHLIRLRVEIEAGLDFSDEPLESQSLAGNARHLQQLTLDLECLRQEARQGCLLREGIQVVIAGAPNVGKSSLLNRLAKRDCAIVSDIPGTTRDVLREEIHLDGLPMHIVDTAGMRISNDPIERLGIERAVAEVKNADRILYISADGDEDDDFLSVVGESRELPAVTRVINKIDLTGRAAACKEGPDGEVRIYLSVQEEEGIDLLVEHLKQCVGFQPAGGGLFSARRRHLEALARTSKALLAATTALDQSAEELLAEELRLAQQALAEITGEVTADDLLGEIFSSFCIGK